MTTIPDGLPTLSAGPHQPDSGKACVMQYVSVIAGEKWSDFPPCTNRTVARVAQAVNDNSPDRLRHKLVPYIDRLYSAGGSSREFVDATYEMLTENYKMQANVSFRTVEDGIECLLGYVIVDQMSAIMYGDGDNIYPLSDTEEQAMEEQAMDLGLKFLDRVLELHDELVKPVHKEVSPEALADAKRLIETRALVV